MTGAARVRHADFDTLDTRTFHAIAKLRIDVFVVEQDCPYPELDGRDTEPTTRHLWSEDADGEVTSYLRLLDDGAARRIGRVVTAAHARGDGLAALLVERAVATSTGPWVLHAQAHLSGWYERFGFEVTSDPFDEDGIAHVEMRRPAPPTPLD